MDRTEYLNQLTGHDPSAAPIVNTPVPTIQQTGPPRWAVVGCWHLSGDQNGGNHHVYADLLDVNGALLPLPATPQLCYSWEGRTNERAPNPVTFDKRPPEPAANIPIFKGQRLEIWIEGESDHVSNLRTDLPDDEAGNSWGHHSYYVVFQRHEAAAPPEPTANAQVVAHVNLRQTPGYIDKPIGDVLAVIPPNTVCPILGGPQDADGLTWWNLAYGGVNGWAAQVDPYGTVLLIIPGRPIPAPKAEPWAELAEKYGLRPAVVAAVIDIESGGRAFGPDGRMIIRFENHIFEQYYHNALLYDGHFSYGEPVWTDHEWRGDGVDWYPVHTGAQSSEWDCFNYARAMGETAAMQSISMGAPQIMGFNYHHCGYLSVQKMFDAFSGSAQAQIEGFFAYLESTGALAALQAGEYLRFAVIYNGTGQAEYYAGLIRDRLGG